MQNKFDKRYIRDLIKFLSALLFSIFYLPHLFCFITSNRLLIESDVRRMANSMMLRLPIMFCLLFLLHNNSYFRTLFYHRIGSIRALLIEWYRPGDKYFVISKTTTIGKSVLLAHPYATILNAESIGDNFNFRHLTTLGAKNGERPNVGNNVTLGACVTIVGGIKIGNNVTIGAGSVVVKNVPDNCIVAGNPAKIIRQLCL